MQQQQEQQRALLQEYFAALKSTESKTANVRKQALSTLVDLLKHNFKQFQDIEATGVFHAELNKGFWDNTFDIFVKCFKTELSKAKPTKGPLEESARCLSKLVLDMFDESEPYFFLRYGDALLEMCKLVFSKEQDSMVYEACARSFADVLRRALRVESAAEFKLTRWFFTLSIDRLLNDGLMDDPDALADFANNAQQQRVNFGEVCRLCMQAWKFQLAPEHATAFLRVCAEYCQTLGKSSRRRNTTPAHVDLITALQHYVEVNGMNCVALLRIQGKRIVDNLIEADRSVVRSAIVLGVFRAMGKACCGFSAHHGADLFMPEDLAWLNVERIQVNLMSFLDVVDVKGVFDDMLRRRVLDEDVQLGLPSAVDTFASCLADYLYYVDFGLKRKSTTSEIDSFTNKCWTGPDLDAAAMNLRCQHLIVVHSLVERWRITKDQLASLWARLEHMLRLVSDKTMVEVFWLVRYLGAVCVSEKHDNATSEMWSQAYSCLVGRILVKPSTPIPLAVCAAAAAAKMVRFVHRGPALVQSLEAMWKAGVFSTAKSKQSPLYLAKLVSALPLHELLIEFPVDEFEPRGHSLQQLEEEESSFSCPSLRCELITWAFHWAMACCGEDSINESLVFANAIQALLVDTMAPVTAATNDLDIGDCLTNMSRLHRPVSSSCATPTLPLTWREPIIKWTYEYLFERAINASFPKLLIVFSKMPKAMFNADNSSSLNKCFQQVATLAQTDLSFLPLLQLALRNTDEIDETNKYLVFTLACTQLDKLFAVPPPVANQAKAATANNKRLKLVKQQREEEEEEEEAMFGSSEPRIQSLSASERSNTLDSVALAASTTTLAPMNLFISRHVQALSQLLVMTCEDNNEAFQLLETYSTRCSHSSEKDINVQLSFAKAMVYLATSRDPATFIDLVLDVVIDLAKRLRDNAEVVSFCASTLLKLAQCCSKLKKFPFTEKQCEEWFVGSKLFLNPETCLLRFRVDKGALLSPQSSLDFVEALFLFANMPGSPEKLFNLAINMLTENLNHTLCEVRNLCSRKLVQLLHAVESHDKLLQGVLESGGWQDYNRTRTNLVFASELAVQSQENLLPQVLVQFTLCLNRNKRGKRKVLVMRLLLCLLKALKYESAKQILLFHAEFLYNEFFSKQQDSQLEHFPFDLFGLESTEELCLVTMHVLVPVLLLQQRRDVLAKFEVCELQQQRANVYGLVHTQRDSGVIRKALRLYCELVNEQNIAASLSRGELVRAINQAMSSYCFQANDDISLQSVSLGALSTTNQTKFSHLDLIEILLHLKHLFTFPSKIWSRVLDCMRVAWLEWIEPNNNTTVNEFWMYIVLFVFAKSSSEGKQLQDQAFALSEQAKPLLTQTQFETCQTIVLDHQQSSSTPQQHNNVDYAAKLVDMFPKSPFGAPRSTELTTSFLLSTNPAISEPRCRSLLRGLLRVLPPRVHTITSTSEGPPLEIARSLRPFVGNTPPPCTKPLSTVDDDVLVDCLLNLCAMDISPQVRNLAAACLARFGKLSPQQRNIIMATIQPSCELSPDMDVLMFKTEVLDWLVEMMSSENVMLAMCACQTIKAVIGTASGKLCTTKLTNIKTQHVLLPTTTTQESTSEPAPGTELCDLLAEKRSLTLNHDSLSKELWDTSAISPNALFAHAEDWICTVTDLLCRDASITGDEFIRLLGPVCLLEPRFAKMVFPWIIFNCVRMDENAVATTELSLCFKYMLQTYESQCRPVQRLLVETVSFLRGKRIAESLLCVASPGLLRSPIVDRLKSSGRSSRGGGNNPPIQQVNVDYRSFWLDLDLLQVAEIALQCDMPSTVILCVEIWQELYLPQQQSNAVGEKMFMTRPKHDELLLGAHRLLNDRDAILGVQRTTNLVDNIEDLRFDGDWLGALTGYDAMRLQTWSTPATVITGQAQTLAQLGLTHTMQGVLANACDGNSNMEELKLEAMWRAQSLTNSADATVFVNNITSIHAVLVNGYQALRSKDLNKLQEIKNAGVKLLLGDLYETESMETRNVCLSRLNVCFDLEQQQQDCLPQCLTKEHFAAREGMLRCTQNSAKLKSHLVEFADFLRLQHESMPAALVLDRLRRECGNSIIPALDVVKLHLQDAMICWLRGDEETALRVAKYFHSHMPKSTAEDYAATQFPPALKCLVGFWLAKSSATSSEVVIHDWFNKAVHECELVCTQFPSHLQETNAFLSGIHHLMATYVDRQFRGLDSRLKSPEYISSQTLQRERESDLKMFKQEFEMEKANKLARKELRTAILRLEKECDMDRIEEDRIRASRRNLLVLTVDHLFAALHTSTSVTTNRDTTSIIFRIIHLWFHNRGEVNDLVKQWLLVGSPRRVPSRHLIPLVYQIVSRVDLVTKGDDAFQSIVNQLVKDLAVDHPFDTLPHLFALSNSNRLAETPTHDVTPAVGEEAASSKRKAATELLQQIKLHSPQMQQICRALESTYDAFIALAYHTTVKDKKEFNANECHQFVLAKQRIIWDLIPLPCSNVHGDVKLHQIEDTYRVTDQGISVPKILTLVGSDGRRTKLLVKGKDDLRQDFVMELILGFVSSLLHNKSPMRLRTYQVLPLTPAAGLIEWVKHTISLGTYLYGGPTHEERIKSAHSRHCPNDLSFNECLHMLKDAAEARSNRLEVYRKVLSQFHPVFRHFFFERYGHDAKEWHKRRDAYTRSTAANSMVGMVLGIGDRHAQNILIDERTAEVIHIDFGVTFEQGKALRTPETVPCRLTPDVVDGFGTAGVQGVFTRACIESLAVLRENADSILTICEVFVHDPLHKWDVSSLKQRRIEARTSTAAGDEADLTRVAARKPANTQNVEAGRVLHRLRQRLEGHVDDGEPLQVAAQVKRVIQEATDEANLCLLYCGWAPFL